MSGDSLWKSAEEKVLIGAVLHVPYHAVSICIPPSHEFPNTILGQSSSSLTSDEDISIAACLACSTEDPSPQSSLDEERLSRQLARLSSCLQSRQKKDDDEDKDATKIEK
jgi:hypothetical protein